MGIENYIRRLKARLMSQFRFSQNRATPFAGILILGAVFALSTTFTAAAQPNVMSADYDANTDQLTIGFDISLMDANANTSTNIGLSDDNGATNVISIFGWNDVSGTADDAEIIITLTSGDAATVEGWPNVSTMLELYMDADAVSDGSLGNSVLAYTNDMSVTYTPPPAGPAVIGASYDGGTDQLTIGFDLMLNDGMTNTSLTLGLSDDNGGTRYINITSWNDISSTGNDDEVVIQLNTTQAGNVEGWPNSSTQLELRMDAGIFSDGTAANAVLNYTDDQSVTYTAPSPGPAVVGASYDGDTDKLTIVFDLTLNDGATNTSLTLGLSDDNGGTNVLNIAGWNDISSTANDDEVVIQLNTTDADNVEGWPNSATQLELRMDAGIFSDGTASNAVLNYSDDQSVSYAAPSAGPAVIGASYDGDTDKLTIVFDLTLNDGATNTSLTLGLSDDNGGTNMINIAGWNDISSTANDDEVVIQLNTTQAGNVEGWPNSATQLELRMDAGIFSDGTASNAVLNYSDDQSVSYIAPSAGPAVIGASYDGDTDKLTIVFDLTLNDGATNTSLTLGLSDDNGGTNMINIAGWNDISSTANDDEVVIQLNTTQAGNVEGWPNSSTQLELRMDAGIFSDGTASNAVLNYSDNQSVSYTAPSAGPAVIGASYDGDTDKLTIVFDLTLNDGSTNTSLTLGLSDDNGGTNMINIAGWNDISSTANDDEVVIQLNTTDADNVEGWPNSATQLELRMDAGIFSDGTASNDVLNYADDQSVSYIAPSAGPAVIGASYDGDTDKLTIVFDLTLNDGATNTSLTLGLSDDNGGTNMINIAGWNDISSTGNDDEVVIQLNTTQAGNVEGWPNSSTQLELRMDAGIFSDGTASNDVLNYADDQSVSYIAPSAGPAVISANYDANNDRLKINFNTSLNDGATNTSLSIGLSDDNGATNILNISGWSDISTTGNDPEVVIQLNTTQAGNVETWPNVSTNLELRLDANAFSDGSNGNLILNYSDNQSVNYIPAGGGNPNVTNASYFADTDRLKLYFSTSLSDGATNTSLSIGLSDDNGATNVLNISGWSDISTTANDPEVLIQLNTTQAGNLEGWPNASTSLELRLDANIFSDGSNGNTILNYADNRSVNYVGGGGGNPSVVSASYDAGTDKLKINFNSSLNDGATNTSLSLGLSDDNGTTFVLNVSGWTDVSTTPNDFEVVIQLNTTQAGNVEAWPNVSTSLELRMDAGIFSNGTATNLVLNYGDDQSVSYFAAGPEVTGSYYDASSNRLKIDFDASLNDGATNTGVTIGLSDDNGTSRFVNLAGWSDISGTANDNKVLIQLTTTDAGNVESWPNATTNLELRVDAGAFSDGTNSNVALTYAENQHVTYLAPGPEVNVAYYDANTDRLMIEFNATLNDGMTNTSMSIGLSDDNGATRYVNIAGWTDISSTVNDYQILIQLNTTDAGNVESWPNVSTNLELRLDAGVVSDGTDGNLVLNYSDNQSVNYTPASGGNPSVIAASYDAGIDRLKLFFDASLNDGSTNTSLTIGLSDDNGVTNTLNISGWTDISSTVNDPEVWLQLNTTQADQVESWPNVSTNLELRLDAGVFSDGSNSNLILNYADNQSVNYIPAGGAGPNVTMAFYDANDNRLKIDFNASLNDGATNSSMGIGLSDDNGTTRYVNIYGWTDISGTANDNKILIQLNTTTADNVESWPNVSTNLELRIDGGAFSDGSNANGALNYSDNQSVNYIPASGSGPGVVAAMYEASTDRLGILFDTPLSDGLTNTSLTIGLSDDNGVSRQINLSGWMDVSVTSNDFEVLIQLNTTQAGQVESWPNVGTMLELRLDPGIFSDGTNTNSILGYMDNRSVNYVPAGGNGPGVTMAGYEASTDRLMLNFSTNLNDGMTNTSLTLGLSDDNGTTRFINISMWNDVSITPNDPEVWIQLNTTQANQVESWPNVGTMLELRLDAGIFSDGSNGNMGLNYADNRSVNYIPMGAAGPMVVVAGYDANSDRLMIGFNSGLNDAMTNTSLGIGLSDDGGVSRFVNIYGWTDVSMTANDPEVAIQLNPTQAAAVEGWPNVATNLRLRLDGGIFMNGSGGNPILSYTDNQSVGYIPGGFPPAVLMASYDGNANRLKINFDRPLNDGATNTSASIGLSDDNGVSRSLSLYGWYDVSATPNDPEVVIQLSTTDANYLESWPMVSTSLELTLDAGTFWDGPYGNNQLTFADNRIVTYGVPVPGPMVVAASYDAVSQQLILGFDMALNDAATMGSGGIGLSDDNGYSHYHFISGWTDISPVANDPEVIIQLTSTDAATVMAWPMATTLMELSLSPNVFSNGISGNPFIGFDQDIHVTFNAPAPPPLPRDTSILEDVPFAWQLFPGALPPGAYASILAYPDWMTFNGTDSVIGTPVDADVGQHELVILRGNPLVSFMDTVSITVLNVNDPPHLMVVGSLDTVAIEDSVYAQVLRPVDPDDDTLAIRVLSPTWLTMGPIPVPRGMDWTLSGTPLNEHVNEYKGSDTVVIRVTDGDTAFHLHFPMIVQNTNDPPETRLVFSETEFGAARYEFAMSDVDYNDPDTSLMLEFQLTRDQSTTSLANGIVFNPTLVFGPLYDGKYRVSAKAVDKQGASDPTPATDVFDIFDMNQRVTMAGEWVLASMPVTTFDMTAIQQDQDMQTFRWDEDRMEHVTYSKYRRKSSMSEMKGGMGFWVYSDSGGDTVTLSASNMVTTLEERTFELKQGWNQVGSPYPFAVTLKNLRTGDPQWQPDSLWGTDHEGGGAYKVTDVMEPWSGYWMYSDRPCTVSVEPRAFFYSDKPPLAKRAKMDDDWQIRVLASVGNRLDRSLRVGISPLAKPGLDRADLVKPPVYGNNIEAYLERDETGRIQRYATDIREKLASLMQWEFVVDPNGVQGDIRLQLEDIDYVPESHWVYLGFAGDFKDMRKSEVFDLAMSDSEERYFTLVVTDDPDFLSKIFRKHALNQNYPNPFNPVTQITYVMPYRWETNGKLIRESERTSLRIYDVRGRLVKTLVDKPQEPGMYRLVWSAKDNQNRPVASSVYFYRLVTPNFAKARKMILIK